MRTCELIEGVYETPTGVMTVAKERGGVTLVSVQISGAPLAEFRFNENGFAVPVVLESKTSTGAGVVLQQTAATVMPESAADVAVSDEEPKAKSRFFS